MSKASTLETSPDTRGDAPLRHAEITAGALMPRYHRQQGMTVSFADKARFATVTP